MRIFRPLAILLSLSMLGPMLGGCARDLSSNMYTSDASLNVTLQGVVLAVRPIIIKESDKLSNNTTGMVAGGVLGGVAGSTAGSGSGTAVMIAGGVLAGALLGSVIEGRDYSAVKGLQSSAAICSTTEACS